MLLVNNISVAPRQSMTLTLADGSQVFIQMEYKAQQNGWFITELTYTPRANIQLQSPTFTLQGFRIFTSPNFLRQYKNLIPFGLACYVTNNQEPTLVTDFSQGRANLYLLTAAEVQRWEQVLSGAVVPTAASV